MSDSHLPSSSSVIGRIVIPLALAQPRPRQPASVSSVPSRPAWFIRPASPISTRLSMNCTLGADLLHAPECGVLRMIVRIPPGRRGRHRRRREGRGLGFHSASERCLDPYPQVVGRGSLSEHDVDSGHPSPRSTDEWRPQRRHAGAADRPRPSTLRSYHLNKLV